jgi:hypothetical protein
LLQSVLSDSVARQFDLQIRETPRLVPLAFAQALAVPPETVRLVREQQGDADAWVEVMASECWLETPMGGTGWVAVALMIPHGGTAAIGELRVYPVDSTPGRPYGLWKGAVLGIRAPCPRGGVTHRLLRRVPLGKFALAIDDFVRKFYAQVGAERMRRLGFESLSAGPRSRRPLADVEVARIAAVYTDAVTRKSRRALHEVLAVFPQHETPERIRAIVHEARRRGLLERKSKNKGQGAAYGRLTPKGRGVIAAFTRQAAAMAPQEDRSGEARSREPRDKGGELTPKTLAIVKGTRMGISRVKTRAAKKRPTRRKREGKGGH